MIVRTLPARRTGRDGRTQVENRLAGSLVCRPVRGQLTVESDLVALPITVDHEDDHACDALEAHESETNVGSAILVPVILAQLDLLCRLCVFGLGEVENVRSVDKDLDCLGSAWDILLVFVLFSLAWDGGDLDIRKWQVSCLILVK